jgi:hypothetical protein
MRNTRSKRRNTPLEVESLESMTLLSGLAMVNSPPAAAPVSFVIPIPVIASLDGTTRGFYVSRQKNPDVGTSYDVFTTGNLAHYGPAFVSGSLHSLGNVASGQAKGTLNVFVAGGTLTLKLTGPTQNGLSPLPTKFSFVVTQGTGKFHNAAGEPVGKGTVDVMLTPGAGSSAMIGHGMVTLVFHSSPVVVA